MRILFLCRNSFAKTAGGVWEFLHFLPPALKALDIEVLMYDMGNETDFRLQGPHVLPNGMLSYSGPVIRPALFVSQKKLTPLLKLVKQEKIDLIHAQGTYRSGFAALQIFKHSRTPYVIMSHGDIAAVNSDRIKRGKVRRRCREILRHAHKVSHLTPIMAEASHEIFDTQNKSVIIGNGIDLASWRALPAMPEQNYILGIGRLTREKGFHVLIDAYAKLCKLGKETTLVIAGTGPENEALQKQARNLGLNTVIGLPDVIPQRSVVFTGYIKGELKNSLIAQCSAMLFPTQPALWEEPFGIVQIEAMAAGKILIASDSGTTRYLQDLGLQAVLVKPDEPADWADKIASVLDDAALRLQLGRDNVANVEQFDWSVIAGEYRDLYLSC
jgi:glycosyltransferase involved in cell wall biosynthesis